LLKTPHGGNKKNIEEKALVYCFITGKMDGN
jgi:hypothetical protein